MGLLYKLKAGSVTNLTDARFFNALEADWIGFNLDVLNERSISMSEAQAIKGWLFEPKIVLECGLHQDKTELVYLCNELQVEAIEVTAEHPILQEDHFLYPVILKTSFDKLQHISFKRALKSKTDIEVIVIQNNEEKFDWENFKKGVKSKKRLIDKLKRDYKVLIDLPFQKSWFLECLEILEPDGIHINAEKEDRPGWSKVDVYGELLELIEEVDS